MAKNIKIEKEEDDEKNIKSRMIRIGLIIALFIIVGAIVLFIAQSTRERPPEEERNQTSNITTPVINQTNQTINETMINETEICNDECLYAKAIEEKDAKYCDWMINETNKLACYVAIANYSLYSCLKIKDENALYNCIIIHANITNNLSLCNMLQEKKALECKRIFEPCYYLNDTMLRICLALKKNDSSYCGNDEDCLLNYSISKNDIARCELISSPPKKQACKAVLSPNTASCDDLSLVSQKEYCWQLYAIFTDNKLMCTEITSESIYALDCYSYFAVKERDVSICDYSGTLQLDNLWECYSIYTLNTGDVTGCQRIHPLATTNLFNCYFEYGKKYGNPMACDMMDNPKFARTCYQGVILNNTNLNYTYCSGVAQIEWKNKCYIESAKLYNDVSLCNHIQTELERKGCIDAYNLYISKSSG